MAPALWGQSRGLALKTLSIEKLGRGLATYPWPSQEHHNLSRVAEASLLCYGVGMGKRTPPGDLDNCSALL